MAEEREIQGLSVTELADRAGAQEEELDRMVALGILVPRDGPNPFRPTDVHRVRLARACEGAGLPMDGIGRAIEQGQVSFAFLEAPAFRRFGRRSDRTYGAVCREAGVPFDVLRPSSRPSGTPGWTRTTGSGRTSWRSFPWFARQW